MTAYLLTAQLNGDGSLPAYAWPWPMPSTSTSTTRIDYDPRTH